MRDDDVAVDGDGEYGEERDGDQAVPQHGKQHTQRPAVNLQKQHINIISRR